VLVAYNLFMFILYLRNFAIKDQMLAVERALYCELL